MIHLLFLIIPCAFNLNVLDFIFTCRFFPAFLQLLTKRKESAERVDADAFRAEAKYRILWRQRKRLIDIYTKWSFHSILSVDRFSMHLFSSPCARSDRYIRFPTRKEQRNNMKLYEKLSIFIISLGSVLRSLLCTIILLPKLLRKKRSVWKKKYSAKLRRASVESVCDRERTQTVYGVCSLSRASLSGCWKLTLCDNDVVHCRDSSRKREKNGWIDLLERIEFGIFVQWKWKLNDSMRNEFTFASSSSTGQRRNEKKWERGWKITRTPWTTFIIAQIDLESFSYMMYFTHFPLFFPQIKWYGQS